MIRRRSFLTGTASLLLTAPVASTPAHRIAAQAEGPVVVGGGMTHPRGFTWDAEGNLIVAETGTGGETGPSGEIEIPEPTGPYSGGPTAGVGRVSNGCLQTVAKGLPSAISAQGEVIGVADVAVIGETLYALVSGGGAAHGNPDQPNGIYTIAPDGTASLFVDLGAWLRANPVAEVPADDYDPEGAFSAMIPSPDAAALFVVESNSEQIVAVSTSGEVTRVADLSPDDMAPTAIAPSPSGGVYVANLSPFPYAEGAASVIEIAPDGTLTTVWSSLTAVSGIAVDADGVLYAAQLAETRDRAPFLDPGTGSIVRQTGPDSSEPVAIGIDFPAALRFGPDGGLYVSLPALRSGEGRGMVVRVPTSGEPIDFGTVDLRPPACGDATAGGQSGGSQPDPATSEIVVRIFDFGFEPAELTIAAGSTVIWANTGAVQHTTVSRIDGELIWDSNIMEAGDIYSFTFTEPGAYDYICGIHPTMTARIVVT
jgi:plastocyanin